MSESEHSFGWESVDSDEKNTTKKSTKKTKNGKNKKHNGASTVKVKSEIISEDDGQSSKQEESSSDSGDHEDNSDHDSNNTSTTKTSTKNGKNKKQNGPSTVKVKSEIISEDDEQSSKQEESSSDSGDHEDNSDHNSNNTSKCNKTPQQEESSSDLGDHEDNSDHVSKNTSKHNKTPQEESSSDSGDHEDNIDHDSNNTSTSKKLTKNKKQNGANAAKVKSEIISEESSKQEESSSDSGDHEDNSDHDSNNTSKRNKMPQQEESSSDSGDHEDNIDHVSKNTSKHNKTPQQEESSNDLGDHEDNSDHDSNNTSKHNKTPKKSINGSLTNNSHHSPQNSGRPMKLEKTNHSNFLIPEQKSNNKIKNYDNETMLRKYLKSNSHLDNVPSVGNADVGDDEDIWIVQCPQNINLNGLQDVDLTQKHKRIRLDDTVFECVSLNAEQQFDNISLLTPPMTDNGDFKVTSHKVNGAFILREKLKSAYEVEVSYDHIEKTPFPASLKKRHPLFGVEYKSMLKLPKSVIEQLKNPINPKNISKKKSRKNIEEVNHIEEEQTNAPIKTSKKRKHKSDESISNDNWPIKKIKKEHPDMWTSELSIEKSLFELPTKSVKKK